MNGQRNQKNNSLLDLMVELKEEEKKRKVKAGVRTFLLIAYLRKTGKLREPIFPSELDVPTTVVSILADMVVDLYLTGTPPPKRQDFPPIFENFDQENVLCQSGKIWLVKYRDNTAVLVNSKGLQYIAHLMYNPGKAIKPKDLLKTFSPGIYEEDQDENLVADRKAMQTLREEYTYLKQELAEAEKNQDLGRIEIAQKKFEEFKNNMLKAGIRSLKRPNVMRQAQLEKMRKSVQKSISRAINNIATDSRISPFAGYLSQHIITGDHCKFDPSPEAIRWVIKIDR